MCEPTSLLALATAGSGLLGLTQKAPKPPPTPAIQATPANDTNADVRDAADEAIDNTAPEYNPFVQRRSQARTLGGLGQSGLAL